MGRLYGEGMGEGDEGGYGGRMVWGEYTLQRPPVAPIDAAAPSSLELVNNLTTSYRKSSKFSALYVLYKITI